MEAAALTTSSAATPIVSAGDQARSAAARPRTPPAPTVGLGSLAALGRRARPPDHASRAGSRRRLPHAPRQRRYRPHGTRSDQRTGTARAPTTSRASIRAWCRYSRACRAAAGATAKCRASIGAPPISPRASPRTAGTHSPASRRAGVAAQRAKAAVSGLAHVRWYQGEGPAELAQSQLAPLPPPLPDPEVVDLKQGSRYSKAHDRASDQEDQRSGIVHPVAAATATCR